MPASPKAQQLLDRMRAEEAHLEAEEKQALQRARYEVEIVRQQLHEVAERKTDEVNKAEQEVASSSPEAMLTDSMPGRRATMVIVSAYTTCGDVTW